jgi:hypothetical protein
MQREVHKARLHKTLSMRRRREGAGGVHVS